MREEIINIINNDEFESGKISKSEMYVEKITDYNELFNNIFNIYYTTDNEHLSEGLLIMMSSIPRNRVTEAMKLFIFRLLRTENNIYLIDRAVQCLEKWNLKDTSFMLVDFKTDTDWLDEYIKQVYQQLIN